MLCCHGRASHGQAIYMWHAFASIAALQALPPLHTLRWQLVQTERRAGFGESAPPSILLHTLTQETLPGAE